MRVPIASPRRSAPWHFVLGIVLAGCPDRALDTSSTGGDDEPGTIGDSSDAEHGDGSADESASDDAPSCQDPSQCDPYNCGPNRTACGDGFVVPLCIDGNCGPRLTHCIRGGDLPPMSCAEICEQLDAVCAANACRDATGYAWSDVDIQALACEEYGVAAPYATTLPAACDAPIDFADPAYYALRCCCDFPR